MTIFNFWNWLIEPFTKEFYKLTIIDSVKAILTVIIALFIIGLIIYGIDWLVDEIKGIRSKQK